MTTKMFNYEGKTLNPIHTTVAYGTDGNVYLNNIEVDDVTDLIAVPVPAWGDRGMVGKMVLKLGEARGWF